MLVANPPERLVVFAAEEDVEEPPEETLQQVGMTGRWWLL